MILRSELIWAPAPIRKDAGRISGDQVAGKNDITNLKWLLIVTTFLELYGIEKTDRAFSCCLV
jgi:hypothetical protein